MSAKYPQYKIELLKVLADGKWHTLGNLAGHVAKYIPPQRAMRAADKRRAMRAADKSKHIDSLEIGNKQVIRKFLFHFTKRGKLDRTKRGKLDRTLKPDFKNCNQETGVPKFESEWRVADPYWLIKEIAKAKGGPDDRRS
jgi:hypothetical protein